MSAEESARERLRRGETYFLALDLIAALEQIRDSTYPGTMSVEEFAYKVLAGDKE